MSFKSHDQSNVTFKFIFTGLIALFLLLIICAVFSVWYLIRKRREEKQRKAQKFEDTFPERLANRSTTGKKIDVGFTSQQTLNQNPENEERRPTFSRFLKLWKGLRNSKRKPANDESGRNVVFTIPTDDVFPKTNARQQTYHLGEDPENQIDGFKTHLCQVHRVNNDITTDYSNHDLHHLEDDRDTVCESERTEETRQVEMITNNESGSLQSCPTLVGGNGNTVDRKTSEEQHLEGKEGGKCFSKESDVDSGCGSSCHDIYTTESQITHAQLNVSSLPYYHAQKAGFSECKLDAPETDKQSEASLESKVLETKAEIDLYDSLNSSSNQQCSPEIKKTDIVSDSFEELIELAKDGMSTLARKRVDKQTTSDCFDVAKSVDTLSITQHFPSNADETRQKKAPSIAHSASYSQIYLDTWKIEPGVKCASSTSSCVRNNNINMHGEALYSDSFRNKNDASMVPATSVVEIPTIILESETSVHENLSEVPISLEQDSSWSNLQSTNNQSKTDNSKEKPNRSGSKEETLHSERKTVSFDKQNDLPLRIVDSFLKNSVQEKTKRPRSMVLPSTSESSSDKAMYGLKVPSLETLNLPSHVRAADHTGRIRSFSANFRRKLSFRERTSSDDMDIEKPVPTAVSKDKKLKGFRSFRVNRKKKTKVLKAQEISQSTGCLDDSDSKQYWSTFEKIFHENTGSAMFADVPFTIPEISEP